MERIMMTRVMSGAAALAACWAGPTLPALAATDAPKADAGTCANGVCKVDPKGAGDKHDDKAGDACCSEGCDCDKDKNEGHDGHDGHEGHEGPHGMRGMHGMHGGMQGHEGGHMGRMGRPAMGPEIRYLPSPTVFGQAGTNQYLILGGGSQWGHNVLSLGFQHNLAIQLFNTSSAGSWIAPYCGIVPRMGFNLGKARFDAGVLGGFGVMARTLGGVAGAPAGAQVLDTRLQWVLEPRIEIGTSDERHTVGLVATYLLTPNPGEFGGLTFGIHATFKGHGK